jgi:hypothetical protein
MPQSGASDVFRRRQKVVVAPFQFGIEFAIEPRLQW